MMFSTTKKTEEYELVDQLDRTSSHSHQFEDDCTNRYNNTLRDSLDLLLPRSSSDSTASRVFDELQDDADDFEEDPNFKTVYSFYQRGPLGWLRKAYMATIGALTLLWVFLLIFYSQMSASQAISMLRWHTDLHLHGYNVTLNPYNAASKNYTIEQYRKNWGASYRIPITWLHPRQYPKNGGSNAANLYLTRGAKGSFVIQSISSAKLLALFESPKFAYKNNFFNIDLVILNPAKPYNKKDIYHIVVTDKQDQWRHLSFSLFWLYNTATGDFKPIQPPSKNADSLEELHFVEFSPTGDLIVFAFNHNLYIQDLQTEKVTRITKTGSPDVFHGKPDWIYEEEVTEGDRLIWWSPNGESLIYATLNDTLVPSMNLNYYVKEPVGRPTAQKSQKHTGEYVSQTSVKHPGPGMPNPVFALSILNVKLMETKAIKLPSPIDENSILYRGSWFDDKSFLLLSSDRVSEVLTTAVISAPDDVKVILTVNASQSYGGWIEKMSPICMVPGKGYIDKIVVDGYVHLGYFSSATEVEPFVLTQSKDWEVVKDSPLAYNKEDNHVYFLATIRSSMDAHLMAVSIDGGKPVPITDIKKDGSYEIDFSEGGTLLNLIFLGPGASWQRLLPISEYGVEGSRKLSFESEPINFYKQTEKQLATTNLPTKNFRTVKIGKYKDGLDIRVNIMEIFPPKFNPKKKHPLVVHAYGGPGSQQVQKGDQLGFLDVLSASLNAVILVIDPRGTQGHGWKFKTFARHNLGYYEPRDIVTVASEYISVNKDFIDDTRTAMWGWSYGAFVTLKSLEFDAGKTIRYGMAVAPVTNWMFYDSVYTERYMGLPGEGYSNSTAITNYENFKSCGRFLLIHGTADDNVQFKNLAWLVDNLNVHSVENYDVQYYPDSDHSIIFHNADSVIHDKLLHWLQNAFEGRFDNMH